MPSSTAGDTIEHVIPLLNLTGESAGFYENYYMNRGDSPINSLVTDIKNDPKPIKVLFAGNRGSGKTTELYNLKYLLEREGYFVLFVAGTQDMNTTDLYYTDVLLTLIKKSMQLLTLQSINVDKKLRKQLEKQIMQLAGELFIEETRVTRGGLSLKVFTNWLGGFFGLDKTKKETIRAKANSLVNEILKNFNTTITLVENTINKKIVILVDDLEKVTDHQRMSDILLGYSNVIGALNCRLVLTVPLSLLYSPMIKQVNQTYGYTYFLPLFQVSNKDGSNNIPQIKIMENVIRKRVSDRVFPSSLLQIVALRSGGVITDYIRMLKISANKALNSQAVLINNSFIDEAFNDIVTEFDHIIDDVEITRGLEPQQHYQMLKDVHNNKDIPVKDELFRKLLFHLFILEYKEHGLNWYDIHPAVEKVLMRKRMITV